MSLDSEKGMERKRRKSKGKAMVKEGGRREGVGVERSTSSYVLHNEASSGGNWEERESRCMGLGKESGGKR